VTTQFKHVVDVVGSEAALKLVKVYSGTTLRIPAPKNIKTHPISLVIGEKLTLAIINKIGHSFHLYIPKQKTLDKVARDQSIVNDYLNGKNCQVIAIKYQMSDRNVWRILKKTKVDLTNS